ncbi:MAG: hypothetical protein BWY87_00091 [Deltaproteobacteria bacterium ADurb.Bin510]|nr:MAG: hypothetical protein BWY87_00091 [Deltaproteobacteria bacterium ADurb.Bin510]
MLHRSVIAGSWYPGERNSLKFSIEAYLNEARIEAPASRPLALISPHAGHMYSGAVAAHAYKAVQGLSYETVVIVSPSHRMRFDFVAVWSAGAFETPLGLVEVDEQACRRLMQLSDIVINEPRPHVQEHALEIQLPFLQVALPAFRLVPLIMGDQTPELCFSLAEALKDAFPEPDKVLVVASSDLSHFHSVQAAADLDNRLANHLAAFDTASLASELASGAVEACGGGPILTAMRYAALRDCPRLTVVKQADSSAVSGDTASVVGYLAAVIA